MPGFASPGILFLSTWDAPERSFCRTIFTALRERGYTRYVEPCAAGFAMPLVAAAAGWKPAQMETSDVGLYPSIVGYLLAGKPLTDLHVTVDGEPAQLPDGPPVVQAAHLLWLQLLVRTQARPQVEYWNNMVTDLIEYGGRHRDYIRTRLDGSLTRLGGLHYEAVDVWKHLEAVADDPHTLISINPPTFKSGFERFFDTKGRLTWDEPGYEIWDPYPDTQRLHETLQGRAALLVYQHQKGPGEWATPPVFGRWLSPGQYVYLNSNRNDEIFEITGGPKVATRRAADLTPMDIPILDVNHKITAKSQVQLLPVKAQVVDYYRNLWMHRLNAAPGSNNLLVLVDGHVAGVIGYGTESMVRPYPHGKSKWEGHIILRFAFGTPHHLYRTTRLATMLALARTVAEKSMTGQSAVYLAASEGLMTVEMTRHPEIKGLRGLMKLGGRVDHPDGYKLLYHAPWSPGGIQETLEQWLGKEKRWQEQKQEQKQQLQPQPAQP